MPPRSTCCRRTGLISASPSAPARRPASDAPLMPPKSPRHAVFGHARRAGRRCAPTRSMPNSAAVPGPAPRRRARWLCRCSTAASGRRHRRRGGRAGVWRGRAALRRAGEPAGHQPAARADRGAAQPLAAAGERNSSPAASRRLQINLLTVISATCRVLEDLSAIAADPFAQQLVGAGLARQPARRRADRQVASPSRAAGVQPAALDGSAPTLRRWPTCCAARSTSASASRSTRRPIARRCWPTPAQLSRPC